MRNLLNGSLFLAVETGAFIAIIAAVAVVCGAALFTIGWFLKKKSFEKKQGDIRKITDKMLDDAREEGKKIKKA